MQSQFTPIRIILADDHEIFRDGFNVMLKKQDEIKVEAEASDGKELLELIETYMPDIVLTDIKMPRLNGIEATRIIKKKYPDVYVIALSMFDDDNLIIDMLEAGAKGYLLKNSPKNEIIEAIKTVYKNELYYCKSTSNKLIQMMAQSKFNPYKDTRKPTYSSKEIEIILLICQQYTTKEIASTLFLSIRTIEGYREKIQEKMKVKNTAGIVVYAIKNGIYKI
jgi:DNA-binding NarL/FixJ family response regulator